MGLWEGPQNGTRTSWQLWPRICLHMPSAATPGGKEAGERCRDAPHYPSGKHRPQLCFGSTHGSAGTPSPCRFCPCVTHSCSKMSPSPSWPELAALREILTSKPHLPGCSGRPTALPTHNPPGQGGISAQTAFGAGQSSLPGTAGGWTGSRGGSGRAADGPRYRGASPLPAGPRHDPRHGWAVPKRPGLGGPSGTSPPTAPAAFPPPEPGVCAGTGGREKAPEGNGESDTKPAGGEQEGFEGCRGVSGGAHLAGMPALGCSSFTVRGN